MRQRMYCYATGPIDNWYGMHTFESLEHDMGGPCEEFYQVRARLERLLGACLPAFRDLGWEGDYNEGPAFFLLPNPEDLCFDWGIAVKQGNNGSCFIASPFMLTQLDNETAKKVYAEV